MKVTLLTGCNLGSKEENMLKVQSLIEQHIGIIEKRSNMHYSTAWGFDSEDSFVNQALLCDTTLTPKEVLLKIWHIERMFGKERGTEEEELAKLLKRKAGLSNYESRYMDIDIIFYDNITLNTPLLSIPHPLYQEREFALTPLREIHKHLL